MYHLPESLIFVVGLTLKSDAYNPNNRFKRAKWHDTGSFVKIRVIRIRIFEPKLCFIVYYNQARSQKGARRTRKIFSLLNAGNCRP